MNKIERMDKWFNELPEDEKDMPYFKMDGKLISPRKRLVVERAKIKVNKLSGTKNSVINTISEVDTDDIVKQRTEILVKNVRKRNQPMIAFGTTNDIPINITEMSKELDNNTAVGLRWKEIQLQTMKRNLAKLEE